MVGRNIWGIIWSRQDCNQSSVIRVMSALRVGQAEPKAPTIFLSLSYFYSDIRSVFHLLIILKLASHPITHRFTNVYLIDRTLADDDSKIVDVFVGVEVDIGEGIEDSLAIVVLSLATAYN